MQVKNIKVNNLRNVEILDTDLGAWNIIAGKNGSGKSTLIDAIFGAICGKRYFSTDPVKLIKHNQNKAEIELTLQDKTREIVITRTITKAGDNGKMYLNIACSDGTKLLQRDLDTLLSAFTIDPLWFKDLSAPKQNEVIKEVAGIDTTEIDETEAKYYEKRANLNREVKRLKGVVDTYEDTTPTDIVDTQALLKQKDEIIKDNEGEKDENTKLNKEIFEHNTQVEKAAETNTRHQKKIDDLSEQIEGLVEELKKVEEYPWEKEGDIKKEATLPIPKSTEELDMKIEDAFIINERAVRYTEYKKQQEEYNKAQKDAEHVDDLLIQVRDDRKRIIEKSSLPEGMDFNKTDGVTYKGIPFSELNTAETIKLAIKLGTQISPDIRILHIKDGSLLDEDTMKEVQDIIEENDYQMLIEVVGEDEPGAIVMKEGFIINQKQ